MITTSSCRLVFIAILTHLVTCTTHPAQLSSQDSLLIPKNVREEEEDDNVGSWYTFALIFLTGALATKTAMLWSSSRILRKLRAIQQTQSPSQLLSSVRKTSPDIAFSDFYIQYAKGRHRAFSRAYEHLYIFVITTMDVMSALLPFGTSLFRSEALLSLRVIAYCGSFTVLGARALTPGEAILILGQFCVTFSLLYYFGTLATSPCLTMSAWLLDIFILLCFCYCRSTVSVYSFETI